MKVAVPSAGSGGLDDMVGEHFGRVPSYTLVEMDDLSAEVVENTSEHRGGQGLPPEIIHRAGANTMIVSSLGQRAINMFEEMGIMVYVGASGTVRDAIQSYREGKLKPATDEEACKQHAFHDH
ncbi:MAG: NifB/NifX family molybdenum-iron cluster-binding protein [Methanomassiliicoccales archaeon]